MFAICARKGGRRSTAAVPTKVPGFASKGVMSSISMQPLTRGDALVDEVLFSPNKKEENKVSSQGILKNRLSLVKLLVVTTGAVLLALVYFVLLADKASAHGFVTDSRAHLCEQGVNVNCGPVRWEPQSVEGRGDFPEFGVPDGQLAGATVFPDLDAQTENRWVKVNMQGGPHTFHWQIHANHSTNTWDYFITKKGWDPNTPLKRSDLELFCRYIDHGAIPPDDVYNDCSIPNDREGYHVILAVWDIADTLNAFYQAIDVNLSINPNAPAVPAPGFPGDPDRFGDIMEWNPIRAYLEGEVVLHNGQLWRARWYTQNQEPGTTGQWGAWELVGDYDPGNPGTPDPGTPDPGTPDPGTPDPGTPDPGTPDPGTYPAWSSSQTYTGGEIVTYNGQLWRAQWWTQGQVPGADQWGPWALVN